MIPNSKLLPALSSALQDLVAHPSPTIPSPAAVPKRASVALVLRVRAIPPPFLPRHVRSCRPQIGTTESYAPALTHRARSRGNWRVFRSGVGEPWRDRAVIYQARGAEGRPVDQPHRVSRWKAGSGGCRRPGGGGERDAGGSRIGSERGA